MSIAPSDLPVHIPRQRSGVRSVNPWPVSATPVGVSSLQETLPFQLCASLAPERETTLRSRGEVEQFARRICAVVVEVLGGDRGVQQLLRWTTEDVYADLSRRSAALNSTVGRDQRLRRVRAQIRSVRLSWPTDEAAEASVHVRHGQRSRAIAARVELIEGRWLCSALQFG